MRTFSYVTFPASLILKREEIETGKVRGASIITAIYHARGEGRRTFRDPPFDILYGFRGSAYNVDLLSPFEMMRYWEMEKVLPPTQLDTHPTSIWTDAGYRYKAEVRDSHQSKKHSEDY